MDRNVSNRKREAARLRQQERHRRLSDEQREMARRSNAARVAKLTGTHCTRQYRLTLQVNRATSLEFCYERKFYVDQSENRTTEVNPVMRLGPVTTGSTTLTNERSRSGSKTQSTAQCKEGNALCHTLRSLVTTVVRTARAVLCSAEVCSCAVCFEQCFSLVIKQLSTGKSRDRVAIVTGDGKDAIMSPPPDRGRGPLLGVLAHRAGRPGPSPSSIPILFQIPYLLSCNCHLST
ncbi:hypothetical protein FHG87_018147 [Trinorchestia longiramus]|nr:hypothetical protein FHG87_018147 [Trinorchestia longiramus]